MFQGKAQEAMNFYVSLFPGSKVIEIVRYGPDQAGLEGLTIAVLAGAAGSLGSMPFYCEIQGSRVKRFSASILLVSRWFLQGCHIDHEAVSHVAFGQAFIRFIDLLDRDQLNI
jgi:hypothetical protein